MLATIVFLNDKKEYNFYINEKIFKSIDMKHTKYYLILCKDKNNNLYTYDKPVKFINIVNVEKSFIIQNNNLKEIIDITLINTTELLIKKLFLIKI